ncbi:MAG: YceD family protein [Bradymonadia bacterium]
MKPLGMTFRIDDLVDSGRAFCDVLSVEVVDECVSGLLGKLGYRASEPASVSGNVYRTANDEVIVDSRVQTEVEFDCVRCLSKCSIQVDARLDHVLVRGDVKPVGDAIELTENDLDDEVNTFQGDEIDLKPIVRQDLILALPMNPTCEDGNAEACDIQSFPGVNDEPSIDPRWAALAELKKKLKPEDGAGE